MRIKARALRACNIFFHGGHVCAEYLILVTRLSNSKLGTNHVVIPQASVTVSGTAIQGFVMAPAITDTLIPGCYTFRILTERMI